MYRVKRMLISGFLHLYRAFCFFNLIYLFICHPYSKTTPHKSQFLKERRVALTERFTVVIFFIRILVSLRTE